jgi:hypothetical protein
VLSYKIYENESQLPENWNELGCKNIFLSKEYFEILRKSAPSNMICHYIGVFEEEKLVGIGISQFLDLNLLESFGERDQCLKTSTRKFILKKFGSYVLVLGNNMLTGQNSYYFSDHIITVEGIASLKKATEELKAKFKLIGKKVHITTFKDYTPKDAESFNQTAFKNSYRYCIQPNMVLQINKNWNSEQDYIDSLTKKYRDQYKRARKKCAIIVKVKLDREGIITHEETIFDLYHHVAQSAPFNTFFLPKNHFSIIKEIFKDNFLFYGYFLEGKLVGFNTLIKNGNAIDTYFLGYDDSIQKERMLYLNMLYDMIGYTIHKGFSKIIFSRTALEIKSSVGAKPVNMCGFMEHSNKQINKMVPAIFPKLVPDAVWQERNPFKE